MSTLLKKVTSAMTVGAVIASTLGTSIVAAASGFLPYAEALADAKVISKQSTEAGYRLADNALRQEVAAMMMALNKATYADNFACANKFTDVSATKPNSWICKVVETALSKGLISANEKFRPEDKITRAEALAMILKGQGIAITTGAAASFNDTSIAWQKDVANTALAAKIVSANASFRPNDLVTRGELFVMAANAAGLEIASDDLNLDDLLNPGDTSTGTTTDTTSTGTTTDTTTPVVVKAGDLNVSLNPSNAIPAGTTLPVAAWITVGKIDLTAGSSDVSVNSIKLYSKWVGARTDITWVSLFVNGAKVAKSKTISSDDYVDLNMISTLVVKAGSTVTVSVVVSTAAAAWEHYFEVAADSVSSSAANVKGTFPMATPLFKTSTTSAGTLTFAADGSLANVKLGAVAGTLAKFKASTDGVEDITLNSITLKKDSVSTAQDTDVANLKLFMNGTEVAKGELVNKYVTFQLNQKIEKNKSDIKFEVRWDVVGGPSKTLKLVIDSTTDVSANGSKYQYGANVAGIATVAATVTFDAGAVSIEKVDATNDKVMKNKKDVVLGTLKITANSGKDVEWSTVKFTIDSTNDAPVWVVFAQIENLELYNQTTGNTYDLSYVSGNGSKVYSNTDLGLYLKSGVTYTLQVRADTKTTATNGDYTVKIANATGGDVVMKEVSNDQTITDITPNAVSLKKVTVNLASFATTQNALSTALSAVIGTADVELINFNLKANDVSDLKIRELKFAKEAAASTMDNTLVSGFKLYQVTTSGDVLVKSVGTSDLASSEVTFRDLAVVIPQNTSAKFRLVTSLVKDTGNNTKTLQVRVSGYSVEDKDGTSIYDTSVDANSDGVIPAATAWAVSARTVTVNSTGTATVAIDLNDSVANKDKNIMAWATSEFLAAYKITAQKEGVKVKDVTVTFDADISSSVATVILYKGDKTTEVARETATAAAVTFTNIPSYVVAEGTETMYVKVITRNIGKDQAWAQVTNKYITSLAIPTAEGASSGDPVTIVTESTDSKQFSIIPVRVSNVAFVSSFGGETVSSQLTNGENTVGIIAVTTDASSNTNSTDGSALKTELESMKVTFSTDSAEYDATPDAGDISAVTVKRINGTVAAQTVAQWDGTAMADATVLNTTWINLFRGVSLGADEEIANSDTAYYVVKATFSGLSSALNKYVQLKLDSLDSGNVEYSSNNSDDNEVYNAVDNITSLRIGTTSVSGPSIASKY